jgi:hypothetical protein
MDLLIESLHIIRRGVFSIDNYVTSRAMDVVDIYFSKSVEE